MNTGGRIRRTLGMMLATALSLGALAGCVPNGSAVGDSQKSDTAVSHSEEDRASVTVALIGSSDTDADSMAMNAMESGKLKPIYITVSGTDDEQRTAQQGVRDMSQRKADIIIVSGINVTDDTRDAWNEALETARKAGIPVALLNPVSVPDDDVLYAATLTVNDRMSDAVPLADAVVTLINNDAHEREIFVTTMTQ